VSLRGSSTEHLMDLDASMAEVKRALRYFHAAINADGDCRSAYDLLQHGTQNRGAMNELQTQVAAPWVRFEGGAAGLVLDPRAKRRLKRSVRALNKGMERAERVWLKRCGMRKHPTPKALSRRRNLLEF